MKIINEIVEVGGRRWKIREAKSHNDALNEIAHARCTGSVGGKSTLDKTRMGGGISVIADVVQINSDDSERQPYTLPY